jgi:hypothetical protein
VRRDLLARLSHFAIDVVQISGALRDVVRHIASAESRFDPVESAVCDFATTAHATPGRNGGILQIMESCLEGRQQVAAGLSSASRIAGNPPRPAVKSKQQKGCIKTQTGETRDDG